MKLLVIVEHTPMDLLISWELARFRGFPGDLAEKNQSANVGDMGSVCGLGRFPWTRAWHPSPISCLENPHGQRRSQRVGHSCVQSQIPHEPLLSGAAWHFRVCVYHCCPCAAKMSVTSETQLVTVFRKVLH